MIKLIVSIFFLGIGEQSFANVACPICLTDLTKEEILFSCGHAMHRECFLLGMDAGSYLGCYQEGCKGEIELAEAFREVSEDDPFKKEKRINHLKKLKAKHYIETHDDVSPSPCCEDGYIEEGLDNNILCSACKQTLCILCKKVAHSSISCDQVQSDTLQSLIMLSKNLILEGISSNFGFCPCCYTKEQLTMIEHKDGCQNMVCGNNARDKIPIYFKNNTYGCGFIFNWEDRIAVDDFIGSKGGNNGRIWLKHHTRIPREDYGHKIIRHPYMNVALTREELTELLDQGVRSFVGVILNDVDLSHMDFSPYEGILLSDAKLVRTNLRGANISNMQMFHNDFKYADLSHVNARRCNLKGCKFNYADLRYCDFSQANLEYSVLSHAKMRGAILYRTNFCYQYLDFSWQSVCTVLKVNWHIIKRRGKVRVRTYPKFQTK